MTMSTRAGYAGFDPLGFSDYYDINWLKEAEIKHGRICMLAALGMVSCRALPENQQERNAFSSLSMASSQKVYVD